MRVLTIVTALLVTAMPVVAAEHVGQVTFTGFGVRGATVTASRADARVVPATDERGAYHLDLGDGGGTIGDEMPGSASASPAVTVAAGTSPSTWELTLLPFA